jgi:hypothetical protein
MLSDGSKNSPVDVIVADAGFRRHEHERESSTISRVVDSGVRDAQVLGGSESQQKINSKQ